VIEESRTNRCRCGSSAHPLYGNRCEDCWINDSFHFRPEKDEVGNRGNNEPDFLSDSIAELELPVRMLNRLEKNGILTLGDLVKMSEGDVLKVPWLGPKAVEIIRERLKDEGLKLRGDPWASCPGRGPGLGL